MKHHNKNNKNKTTIQDASTGGGPSLSWVKALGTRPRGSDDRGSLEEVEDESKMLDGWEDLGGLECYVITLLILFMHFCDMVCMLYK